MDSKEFTSLFSALHNMDRWTLEDAGLIPRGKYGDDNWTRFNKNLTTFVLKLSDDNVKKLVALVRPGKEAA